MAGVALVVAAGATLAWPGGERPDFFDDLSEFPPAVAQEARTKWTAGTDDWKKEQRDRMSRQRDTHLEANKDVIRGVGFVASFGFHDILWFVLAIGASFKAGSHGGTGGSEE